MSDEATFLDALKANPADDTARLVYADWLDEHNEPQKAEYVRLVVAYTLQEGDLAKMGEKRLLGIAKGLPSEWREAAGSRFSLILTAFYDKIRAIKWIRELTGDGLGEAKEASENLPHVLLPYITFERAWAAIPRDQGTGAIEVRITPTDPDQPDGPANCELVVYCSMPGYTVGDTTEARAALVKFLTEVVQLSEEDAERQATLNTPIVYRRGLTRDQARSERSAVGGALPPYDPQRRWWLTVMYQRAKPTNTNE